MKWILAAILFCLFFPLTDASALDLELGAGTTVERYGEQEESEIYAVALATAASLPTEVAIGHIAGSNVKYRNLDKPVNFISIGKRLQWKAFFVGLGIALVDQTSQRLSTYWNFKSQIGITWGLVAIKAEHLSNAGLEGENDGETFLTLSYVHRFGGE